MEKSKHLQEFALEALRKKYGECSTEARFSTDYRKNLEAALLAPSAFLLDTGSFEVVFDAVVHHLSQAFQKAPDDTSKGAVLRTAEELFHQHVTVLGIRIDVLREENKKGFFKRWTSRSESIASKIPYLIHPGLEEAFGLISQAALLLNDYFLYLAVDWHINEKEDFFYLQIGRIYRKIIASNLYSPGLLLLQNTFIARKEDVLRIALAREGVAMALSYLILDTREVEILRSLDIILDAIAEKKSWNESSELYSFVKKNLPAHDSSFLAKVVSRYEKYMEIQKDAESGRLGCQGFLIAGVINCVLYFFLRVLVPGFATDSHASDALGIACAGFGLLELIFAFFVYPNLWARQKVHSFRQGLVSR